MTKMKRKIGSQALVSFVLQQEFPTDFSLVAEEDSKDLRKDGAQEVVDRITKLVNDSLTSDGSYNVTLSTEDVLKAIDSGRSEGGSQGRHWVLDPTDDGGKVVLGVMACPNLPITSISAAGQHSPNNEVGWLFLAEVGGGTYMQPFDGSSAVKKLGVKAPPVRIDSHAKYGALSRGDGAIYLRFPHKGYREKIWDHAAGCIVVTEAGGVVTDAAGKPLDFSKGKYLDLDTGIIVTNQKLMPLLLNAVRESLKEKVASL
ncbi:hypothetical protein V6N11_081498 [Hibiscus sabdariffa]